MKNLHHISQTLTDLFHREDPTRKVTSGCNNANAARNGFGDTLDVYGYNYKPWAYKDFAKDRPHQPFYGAETASCVSSRGEYFFPVDWNKGKGFYLYQVSSYDLYAPGWANRPDVEFAAQEDNPNSAGEYVWTGFDYIGEPTPYNLDATNALNVPEGPEREKLMAELKNWETAPPPAAPTSASWTCAASKRTASTSTKPTGGRISRWRTSCRTGTGRNARGR